MQEPLAGRCKDSSLNADLGDQTAVLQVAKLAANRGCTQVVATLTQDVMERAGTDGLPMRVKGLQDREVKI